MMKNFNNFKLIAKAEIKDSITAKWFFLYSFVFGGAVIALYLTGITESQVMGFVGISRLLLTYFQLCIVVLPVFILITTVRSIVGDKESNVFEYLLSMPVSFRDFFWGKLTGETGSYTHPGFRCNGCCTFMGKGYRAWNRMGNLYQVLSFVDFHVMVFSWNGHVNLLMGYSSGNRTGCCLFCMACPHLIP